MTLYDRLNLIGVTLTEEQREDASKIARVVRTYARTRYSTKKRTPNGRRVVTKAYDDELGALADQLDTLAGPIVVKHGA